MSALGSDRGRYGGVPGGTVALAMIAANTSAEMNARSQPGECWHDSNTCPICRDMVWVTFHNWLRRAADSGMRRERSER